jgi:hypothetical protein
MARVFTCAPRRYRQLALAVDTDDDWVRDPSRDAYRLAAEQLGTAYQASRARLESYRPRELIVIDCLDDDLAEVLWALDLQPTLVEPGRAIPTGAKIVFIGSSRRGIRLPNDDLHFLLEQGGILVTSGSEWLWPRLQERLPMLPPRSGSRARLRWHWTLPEDYRPAGGLSPLVVLRDGHGPLDPAVSNDPNTTVLAFDALTDNPLVVLTRVGGGLLLHGVPAWFQRDIGSVETAAESRLLAHVPAYAELGRRYPAVTLGEYLAAEAMLTSLLVGLTIAFREIGLPEPLPARGEALQSELPYAA